MGGCLFIMSAQKGALKLACSKWIDQTDSKNEESWQMEQEDAEFTSNRAENSSPTTACEDCVLKCGGGVILDRRLVGNTFAQVLSRCGKTPAAADCSDELPGTQCCTDPAEWKRVFVFAHSPEDAQHTAEFFTTELLAAGELHRPLQGRAELQHVFLVEAKHVDNDDLVELLAVGIVRTMRGCTG